MCVCVCVFVCVLCYMKHTKSYEELKVGKNVSGWAELTHINGGLHSSGINTAMDSKPC